MKLINGDCLEAMKDIPDNSIDLIVTDPPYLMKYKTCFRASERTHKFRREILNDDNYLLVSNYIKQCYRILKDNTAMYIFCNSNNVDFFQARITKSKLQR